MKEPLKVSKKSNAKRSELSTSRILMCAIVLVVVFISGCVNNQSSQTQSITESVTTPISSSASPKPDTVIADLIPKPEDVPLFTLRSVQFMAIPKGSSYNIISSQGSIQIPNANSYKDTLPLGSRNVGQISEWSDKEGRQLQVIIRKFDSNSGIKEYIEVFPKDKEKCQKFWNNIDAVCGSSDMGDYSWYGSATDKKTGISGNTVVFSSKNYLVEIGYRDDKVNSLSEALGIAKNVEGRLN